MEASMTTDQTDVIVVGAGPTGLLLAGDLAAAGVRVTLLERRREDETNMTRAFGVHARTLEQLDARGLADELVTTGAHLDEFRLFQNVKVDLSRLPSRYPYLLITPQYNTERLLEERARKYGAEFVTGATVTGLTHDGDGVDIQLADGSVRRASYVVGADGVRSAVRQALGLPYPGRSV